MAALTSPVMVVGLGNPGGQYSRTRHNIGHLAIDALADETGQQLSAHKKSNSDMASVPLSATDKLILCRPRTYMNLSGGPVRALNQFFKVSPASIVVIHDELDLPFGTIRLKKGGGDNGHNGLRDITKALGTKDYIRIRVGIGRPPGRMNPADYVLKPFSTTEFAALPALLAGVGDAVELLATEDLATAQNAIHAKTFA